MFVLRRVHGSSMEPALKANRLVLGCKYFRKLKKGDIVVIHHQGLEKIKRIGKIQPDKVWVVGNNPDVSTDSRQFGWIDRRNVYAKIWL